MAAGYTTKSPTQRLYIIDTSISGSSVKEDSLAESIGLAEALDDVKVVGSLEVSLRQIKPDMYFGKGKAEEILGYIEQNEADIIVCNNALSPIQQRNLEQFWKKKVIDRTALILAIFGQRAQTREGILQVELASLEYQKSRLVRAWTHLERQRGGGGFVGGPGETQKELDRRMLDDSIKRIKKSLEKVKKTRTLHRSKRSSVPYKVVAMAGYTNAGKSTLFNYLTGAEVLAEDKLFATLDPTMRMLKLPSGRQVILSDTVGFIANLPTQLVAAFRATLEEVVEADIILHVRDISDPDTKSHKESVLKVLDELGIDEDKKIIEVLNKIDLINVSEIEPLFKENEVVATSAESGQGLDNLLKTIDHILAKADEIQEFTIPTNNAEQIAWLHQNSEIIDKKTSAKKAEVKIKVVIGTKQLGQYHKLYEKN